MMKVLWLSAAKGLFQSPDSHFYNGCGWVSSLQKLVEDNEEIELGMAFITSEKYENQIQGRTNYYPIKKQDLSALKKILYYYHGYKEYTLSNYLVQIHQVIADFNPDVIHVFGIENPLAVILGETDVPLIVHIQGILSSCDNAFYPPSINRSSFLWPASIREWLFRNGFIFAKKSIHVRALYEKKLFKSSKCFMGRTSWDRKISNLLSPNSIYYHVDEVLRDIFYDNKGKWCPQQDKFHIVSTISETVYKGLDVVLKTAKILKDTNLIDYEWHIVGISSNSSLVRFFERATKIKSEDVNIIYEGVKDECDLCNILLKSSVYVHPSYIDNSPNSLCEAQMLGVPVIGSYVGGIPSLITNNDTGLLFPANDIHELASLLISLNKDKDLLSRISKRAANVAIQRHDHKIIMSSLLETYKAVINQNHPHNT